MEDADPDIVLSSCEDTYSGPMWFVLFLTVRIIFGILVKYNKCIKYIKYIKCIKYIKYIKYREHTALRVDLFRPRSGFSKRAPTGLI